ncbi:Ger(x)C family spore germination C-terminal domain-containing protein, partial [Cohnella sp.]|uniref:Ger(x)C family spore germination protein n=1 Tax=Cohnella sp. TaxID=1883426 RepID=UPI0037047C4F
MRNAIKAAALTILVLAMCGCWDQQLLKDERNISIGGIDTAPKGLIRATVSIRDILVSESGSGKDTSEVHSVVARSTDHARELLDEEVSGQYSSAKMRVLLLGEGMVRTRDIMPYLDVYYRDPRSPLNARVAVAQGKAQDFIQVKMIGPKTIGLHVDDLLKSLELQSQVPRVTIQTLHPLDRGFDFSLPYLKLKDGVPKVEGIALFNGVHMTGKLNLDRSKVYMLLAGEKSKNLRLTLKIQDDDKDEGYNYTTIDVLKARRKLKIHVDKGGRPRVALNVRLRVSVIEDPS